MKSLEKLSPEELKDSAEKVEEESETFIQQVSEELGIEFPDAALLCLVAFGRKIDNTNFGNTVVLVAEGEITVLSHPADATPQATHLPSE